MTSAIVEADQCLLLIDSDDAERKEYAAYLKQRGYSVSEAKDIQQGLDVLSLHQPLLILCDLNVPTHNGQRVLQAIKAQFVGTPVIVMSNVGVVGDVVAALRHGAVDYLIKPIADMQVLEHAITRCLEQDRLRRENLAYRQQLEQANQDLQTSLKVLEQDQLAGRQVQLKMLPHSPKQFGRYRFSHRILPSFYLSGDFVDYFTVGEDYVVFFIADVSGHGASSAFLTVLLKNMFARKRSDYFHRDDSTILSPVAMLDVANRNLLSTGIGKHATLCVGVINLKNESMRYTVAAHLPLPILAVKGESRYLEGEGMPVGLFESAQYTEKTLILPENFVLTFFSDGILEIVDADGVLAQEKYLLEKLHSGPDTIDGVIDALEPKDVDAAPDDIAVLLISNI
jgi:serine phosphatase RsbU (regulator of sigma subunit)